MAWWYTFGMENIKPFQLILLAVFGVAAVAGLYLFATYTGFGGAKENVGPVVVWGVLPMDSVRPALDEMVSESQAYADVTYFEKNPATFSAELADGLASGSGPDLVLISHESLNAEANKLQLITFDTIPERAFIDTYLPLFDVFLTSEGTYGIPVAVDPLLLFYNRTQFASAGIVSPPSSWEALTGLVPSLTRRDDVGAVSRSAIALGDYANVHNARAILSLLLLQAGSPITSETPQGLRSALVGDSTFGATPAQSAVRFYTEFADPSKTVYSWNRSLPHSRQAFIAGDASMYLGFASELPFLRAANPNLDFDIARIPQLATATTRVNYGVGYALAIPKQSKNPTGAYSTALALAGKTQLIATNASMAPALRVLIPGGTSKDTSIYYPEALVAKAWLSPSPSVTDGIFSGMIVNITSGRQDVPEAVHAADQSLNASLR